MKKLFSISIILVASLLFAGTYTQTDAAKKQTRFMQQCTESGSTETSCMNREKNMRRTIGKLNKEKRMKFVQMIINAKKSCKTWSDIPSEVRICFRTKVKEGAKKMIVGLHAYKKECKKEGMIGAEIKYCALKKYVKSENNGGGNGSNEEEMDENAALKIAQESECTQEGQLTDKIMYNENSKTYWINLTPNQEQSGCNPACVVDTKSKTAEINWRCTGLIPPNDDDDDDDDDDVVIESNIDLNYSYDAEGVIELTWETEEISSCIASSSPENANWTGEKTETGGSVSLPATNQETTFTLTCTPTGDDQEPIEVSVIIEATNP